MVLLSSHKRLSFLLLIAWMAMLIGCTDRVHPDPGHDVPPEKKEWLLEGTVLSFEPNDAGDVDKLILQSSDKKSVLHFPPHTAQSIMSIARHSSTIQAMVTLKKNHPEAEQVYELLRLTAGGKSFDTKDLPPPPPQPGEDIVVTGKASDINLNKEGRVRSFIVNKTLVTLPPHVDLNDVSGLTSARSVTVKGFRRMPGDGFVNLRAVNVVRPTSVTIESITFTIE